MIHIINPLASGNHPVSISGPSIHTLTDTSSIAAEIGIIHGNGMFKIQIFGSCQNLYVTPVWHNDHADLSHPVEMRFKTIQYSGGPKRAPMKMDKESFIREQAS